MAEKIIQMNEHTWRIEDGGVRFFLLTGEEKALLIDSGMQVHHAREIAQELTDLPLELLNTHADMDHVGSNEEFEAFYMHPDERIPETWATKVRPIRDGDQMDLGNRSLRIIHLPGHTPGSVAVLDEKNRVLISGDPIQEHGRIFMFGRNRNMESYIGSLERLSGMVDQFDELWSSHADLPIRPDVIGRLIEGAKKIVNHEIEGTTEEFHGHRIVAYDLGFTVLLCDE